MLKSNLTAIINASLTKPISPLDDLDESFTEVETTHLIGFDLSQFIADPSKAPVTSPEDYDGDPQAPLANPTRHYSMTDAGIGKRIKKKLKGQDDAHSWQEEILPLCNFQAWIAEDDLVHQGDEVVHTYKIAGRTAGRDLPTLEVPDREFQDMKWLSRWGAEISMNVALPRNQGSILSNIREAIAENKRFKPPVITEVWDHMGWRKITGEMTYLHAKGGITKDGILPCITVDTKVNALKKYGFEAIPEGEERKRAIRQSLSLLDLGSDQENPTRGDVATVPAYLAMFRATLPTLPEFGIYLYQRTGAGKSTLAALLQGHWDRTAVGSSLAGNWSSTAAALEVLVHAGKNAIVIIDDANRSIPGIDKKLENILRSSGNGASRQRQRTDMSSMRSFAPRGMVVTTGEDLPPGHSCRSRVILVDTPPMVRPGGDNSHLDRLQRDVRDGVMTGAMSAWLQWLAPKVEEIEANWRDTLISHRSTLAPRVVQQHGRSVDQVCELLITAELLMQWAVEMEAVSTDEANDYQERFRSAFTTLSEEQSVDQAQEDPVMKFFRTIPEMLLAGLCHLKDIDSPHASGSPRGFHNNFGWLTDGQGVAIAKGPRIGAIKGDLIYLNPSVAFTTVAEYVRKSGETFNVSQAMFWKSVKPMLVKGDGKHLGKKVTGALVNEVGGYAPCLLISSFPQWANLQMPPRGAATGQSGEGEFKDPYREGEFRPCQPDGLFHKFPLMSESNGWLIND